MSELVELEKEVCGLLEQALRLRLEREDDEHVD